MPDGVDSATLTGTFLAFDFGTRRIGIAVGNTISATARPLTTINDEKNDARFAEIASLLKEWQPDYQRHWLPFLQKRGDLRKAGIVLFVVDGG